MIQRPGHIIAALLATALLCACDGHTPTPPRRVEAPPAPMSAPAAAQLATEPVPAAMLTDAQRIVAAAREQIGVTVRYDSAYVGLDYPMGDVPPDRGVCTDVVVRAMRGVGVDLQQLVHEDMRRAFDQYPDNWGLTRPDANIDHRRVPNLMAFFKRRGKSLAISNHAADYQPGDIVAWRLSNGRPHIGIVSDRTMVVHNIGLGTQESADLFSFEIIGHYRWFE
jgi:hypothetical protein